MSGPNPDPNSNAVHEASLAWLVRIQSDAVTADDWLALTDWLEESEAHLIAFEALEATDAVVDDNARQIAASLGKPDADIIPFRQTKRKSRSAGSLRTPILAMAASLAMIAVLGPALWQAYQGPVVTYRTAPGQTRSITLADGSRIELDAASTLSVRMGWQQRSVTLGDAQASFDVAKDARRPFVIKVGDQRVRVVGTEFNIRHYDQSVVVTVRRGIVQVAPLGLGAKPIARLIKGDELRHVEGAQQWVRMRVDPDAAFSWKSGRLICHDQPLPEIVAYLNRHYPVAIRLSEAASRKRFSGVLELGDQTMLVQRLSRYLDLTVARSDREIELNALPSSL